MRAGRAPMPAVLNSPPQPNQPTPGRFTAWPIDVALALAILIDCLAPLRAFHLRLDGGDIALLLLVVLSGLAIIRGAHALLMPPLKRVGGPWLAYALGVLPVVAVALGGMWHGPPHYSLTTATVTGALFVLFMSRSAAPGQAWWRRTVGGALAVTLFAFLL